jgi:hypothetical protein
MQTRSKVVELSGKKFEVRRLPADVGSFIFMRMMGIGIRNLSETPQAAKPAEQPVVETKMTGEMRVRAMFFTVFSGNISFEDFKFIQNACMKSVSCIKHQADTDFPMPIMTDNGAWTPDAGEEISMDSGMIMKLTSEVLVFCFADFFEEGSLGLQT